MLENFGNKVNTKGLDKMPENINRKGRPKKLISNTIQQLETDGFKETSKDEIKSVYLRLINIDIPELDVLMNDSDQSALVRIVAKEILSDRGFEIIDKMLDRSIGKAQQNVENKVVIDRSFESMTTEELIKRADAIDKISD